MGIFDWFTGGPTPTGGPGATVEGPTGGIGDMMMKGLGANSNTLTMLGLGLLSARTAEQQRQALLNGYVYGSQMDSNDRKEKREEEEKKRKEAKTAAFQSAMAGLYPQYRDAIMSGDTESATALIRMAQDKSYKDQSVGFERERIELARKADERADRRPTEANAPLVERQPDGSYKTVYVPPAKPQGPIKLAEDERLVNPDGTIVPVQGVDPTKPSKKTLDLEASTRKEFTDVTKNFKVIDDSFSRIQSLAKTPDVGSGVSDIGIVYSYMKMLDPTSVVRETEYATAENAGGVGEKLYGLYNKVLAGERLTPELRRQFIEGAAKLYEGAADEYQGRRSQFEGVAKAGSMDPERVLGKFERRTVDPALRPDPKAATLPSTAPEANPAVQELVKRSQDKPELRKKLIEMGLIPPPTGQKPPATDLFRR
jgi:ribosomal protein S20